MSLIRRKEAPLDPFKRAVTLTTRSIAADSGVEVVFTSEPPGGRWARQAAGVQPRSLKILPRSAPA